MRSMNNFFELLGAYFNLGGNFIDTVNFSKTMPHDTFLALICTFYRQDETYEEFLGEWAEKRGIRDQLVIATKVRTFRVAYLRHARLMRLVLQYTSNCKRGNDAIAQKVNYVGNNTKSAWKRVLKSSGDRTSTSYTFTGGTTRRRYRKSWTACTILSRRKRSSTSVFLIRQHRSSPKQISTPLTMARPRSSSIRINGVSWNARLSATSSP